MRLLVLILQNKKPSSNFNLLMEKNYFELLMILKSPKIINFPQTTMDYPMLNLTLFSAEKNMASTTVEKTRKT